MPAGAFASGNVRGVSPPRWALAAGLLVLVGLVWSPVLGHRLVWDDVGLLQRKASVQALDWAGMATSALWADVSGAGTMTPFFRPLTVLSFGVDQALSSMNPQVVHLQSLLWHLVNTALVMWTCRRWGLGAVALGGVLVGVHPVVVEPVAFAAARNDGMATAFCLLAIEASAHARWLSLAVAVALAGFSKEAALVMPAVVALQHRGAGPAVLPATLAASAGVLIVLGARAACGVGWPGAPSPDPVQGIMALATLWSWLAWPMTATATFNVLSPIAPVPWTLGLAVAVGGAVWLLRSAEAERWRVGAALLMLATCVPAVMQTGRIAARYDYLPWLLLAPAVVEAVSGRLSAARLGVAAGFLALLGIWGVALRLPEWKNEQTLFSASVARTPDAQSWLMLGEATQRAGDRHAAFAAYASAIAYDTGPDVACVAAARTAWSGTAAEARAQAVWLGQTAVACRSVVGADDQLLYSAAARGEWEVVRKLLPEQTVSDGTGRSQSVRGAVRLADGDWQALSLAAMRNPAGAGPYIDAAYGVALARPTR